MVLLPFFDFKVKRNGSLSTLFQLLELLGFIERELLHDLQHPLHPAHSLLLCPVVVLELVLHVRLLLLCLVLPQVRRHCVELPLVHRLSREHVLLALICPVVLGLALEGSCVGVDPSGGLVGIRERGSLLGLFEELGLGHFVEGFLVLVLLFVQILVPVFRLVIKRHLLYYVSLL